VAVAEAGSLRANNSAWLYFICFMSCSFQFNQNKQTRYVDESQLLGLPTNIVRGLQEPAVARSRFQLARKLVALI
jgi:hypothetical protein